MPAGKIDRRALLAGLGASLLSGTAARAQSVAGEAVSGNTAASPWSDIELLDADDRSFRVHEGAKPFTLIKLWAHWCPTCLWDLATLPRAAPALQARDIDIVLVSHPRDWLRNQAVARTHDVPLRTARPAASNGRSSIQSALFATDGMFYVPRSLLFCKSSQTIVWNHLGGLDWTAPESLERLRPWVG